MSVKPYEKPKGSGIWYIRISHNGKRKSKKIGDRDAAEEIAKKLEAKMVLGELGVLEEKPKVITFGEIATNYLHDFIKQSHAPSTHERYLGIWRQHIAPTLAKRPITEIRRTDIRNLLLAVGKKLSYSSVCLVKDVCSGIIHYAMDDELIDKNPLVGLTKQLGLDKKRKKRVDYFHPDEIAAFLEQSARSHPKLHLFFFSGFRTGLRLGELCGLRWGDINWVQRNIHVQRSYKRQTITALKTASSERNVDMTAQLIQALREHLVTEKERWLKRGITDLAEQHIFSTVKAGPYAQNSVRNVFKRILSLAGLSDRRVHDVRHTFAAVLLSSGASIYYVKEQMGHASIKVTVDTYGHLIKGSNKGAIEILDNPSSLLETQTTEMQL